MLILSIVDILKPQLLIREKDFLLVYKPPRMHSVPLASSAGETVLDWSAMQFPEIRDLPGRRAGEGGLLHRLDYETQGLMLLARTKSGMKALLDQQKEGKIQKEYSALAMKSKLELPGFPAERPEFPSRTMESAFRPYGPGRKSVRPVLIDALKSGKKPQLYLTEILESSSTSVTGILSFRLRISKGFRHQIRSHLAWMGAPILNDKLYGGPGHGNGFLALRACSLSFNDPSSGEERSYLISPLLLEAISYIDK